ncbi:hypothetical protein K9N68_37625 (plasmid) [Kovacikia minuta CCNUW1]|uniref:hypothetical protein n=1 Tax=Kovacikia minuta TaxID=2931930 RepID=UPI001CCAD959|nr:hypothetical protein [Kovacikia minuta]UBF29934.1 hypothetical protein K9N68_37625 [Kovacikia minuta CCNUW1]
MSKTFQMDFEIREELARRLESGEYIQTTYSLKKSNEEGQMCHCYFGVLAEILVERHPENFEWLEQDEDTTKFYVFSRNSEDPGSYAASIPGEVLVEYAGFDLKEVNYVFGVLSRANDKRTYTFKELAELTRKGILPKG